MNPYGGRRKTAASLMLLFLFSLSAVAVLSLSPVARSYGPPDSQFDCSATSPFGTGSSGNITISTATTLSANMSYGNLTVDSGITLNTGGYSIDVCGTLHVIGAISYTGSAGSPGSTGSAGTNGGAGDGVSCTASSSSAGGNAATNAGGGGGACSTGSSTDATGGAGGSPGGNGGTGHTGASPVLVIKAYIIDNAGSVTLTGGAGGPGGAGGAGGNGAAGSVSGGLVGGGGGGGGGDGGKGGNGGNGGSGTLTIDYGLTSGSGLGTVTAPGGAAGSGQSGGSGGSGGSGVSTTSGICTSVSGGSGSDGSAGGGVTGSGSDCTASNGAAGAAGASGTNGAAGAAGTITETQVSVTQPILVATPTGGSAFTYTVSGCSVFPTSATSGSTATDFTASPSCALTVTMPAASGDERYVFASSASSTTVTTCSTGTCTAFSPTDYYQLQNTFKASYQDGSPSSGAPVWCTQAGTDTSLGDLTTSGVSAWCDYGSVAYAQGFAPGGSSTVQYSAISPTYGLVGYWPLQQGTGTSAYDLSHNNNTGTLENSSTWSSTGGPFTGTGYLNFSTSKSQYVSVADASSLRPSSITFTAWVYANSFANSYNSVLSKETNGHGYTLLVKANGKLAIYLSGGPSCNYDGSGTYTLSTGAWYFLAFTYSNGILVGYVNGAQDQINSGCTNTALDGATGYPLILGGSVAFPPRWWDGRIAYASIYNYALSASEVAQLYAQTPPNLEHTISSGGNTYTFTYYHQYQENPYYTAVSGTPSGDALNYYYSSLGQSLTDTMGTSSATIWADVSTVTVGDHYVSSTERYSSNANTTLSAANTSGPDVSIYHQYDQPVKLSYVDGGTTAIALTCERYGSNAPLALSTSTQNDWADSGGTCSVPSTTLVSSGARMSMGPAYSWTISKSGSVPPTLDAYLQYYFTNPDSLPLTLFSNGTQTGPIDGGYYADATTQLTAAGLSTNPYTVSYPSWLYQVSPSGLQVLANSSLSPAPSLSASSLSFTASGPVKWTLYSPSSAGLTVQTVLDSGIVTPYSGPDSSGSGSIWSASGASPWTVDFASTSNPGGGGGGGYVPPVTTTATLPQCSAQNSTDCEVTNSAQIGLGAIPSFEFLVVILGGGSLFAVMVAGLYLKRAGERAEDELTFAKERTAAALNFSGAEKNRSGPLFRRRKRRG
ncbi:MAG: LamG domain-containing protein [Nitrososphaerota archaeon]|nr:LamG domain-containing protein [Nitrososphaerota archaeon]